MESSAQLIHIGSPRFCTIKTLINASRTRQLTQLTGIPQRWRMPKGEGRLSKREQAAAASVASTAAKPVHLSHPYHSTENGSALGALSKRGANPLSDDHVFPGL